MSRHGSRRSLSVNQDAHWTSGVAERSVGFLLLQIVDIAFLGIIFIAPYFMGGRHPLGRFVFVVFVVVLAFAWFTHQYVVGTRRWTRSPAHWLLLAGVLLILTQLTPLPTSIMSAVSPHTADILTTWTETAESGPSLGSWSQLSLTPSATRGGLVLFFAYGLLFLVTAQWIHGIGHIERILRWIGLSVVIMASFGLVQYIASNGKFLWIYEHPYRNTSNVVLGSFINRNHFTHFLALGIGPLIWWIVTTLRQHDRSKQRSFSTRRADESAIRIGIVALAIAIGVVIFAGLLSSSRGGALAMAVVVTVSAMVFFRAKLLNKTSLQALIGIALLLSASLLIHGYDQVVNRLDDLTAGSLDELDRDRGRRKIWEANLAAFRDNPLLGSGVGSHQEVYPLYLNESLPIEYTHAESGYLQVASEMGTGGLVLLLSGIGLCARWCVQSLRYAESKRVLACVGATSAGLTASVLHSLVDFVWYIPACMSITTILVACTFRLSQLSQPEKLSEKTVAQIPKTVWLGLTTVLFVIGSWMIHDRLGPTLASPYWDEYLHMSRISTERQNNELRNTDSKQEDAERESVAETAAMINQLEKVIAYNPTHARAHLRMAGACLQYFDQLQRASANVMDLSQICDAAIVSQFSSRAELDIWLIRSVGENRKLLEKALWHAHRGLQLCPLQGEGYIYLAELCFLEGGRATTRRAYVDQALKVRPYDGDVLLQAGKVASLRGDVAQAIDYWKRCFQSGGIHQLRLVRLLAGRLPLTFVLDQFNPDLSGLKLLYLHYQHVSSPEELQLLSQRYVSRANSDLTREDGNKAARAWLFANRMYRDLGDTSRAIHSAQQAYAFSPESYQVRYALAKSLLETKQFSEAETHLRWCLGRKPRSRSLRIFMEAAVKGRIRGENRNMSATNANHPQSHR